MGDKLKKLGNFAIRHNEFILGMLVGLATPVVMAKVRQVNLPIQVEASASIDTASAAA